MSKAIDTSILPDRFETYMGRQMRIHLAQNGLFNRMRPKVRPAIRPWIENNIDLARDKTSRSNGFVDLSYTPYGIDVVEAWQSRTVRDIVVMAPPQTGKSCLTWCWPCLWVMANDPGPMLTVYQNQPIAVRINRLRIEPLMEGIPALKRELENPHCKSGDEYRFSEMFWNFLGSGSPITSIPFQYTVADEEEYWNMANDVSRKSGDDDEDESRAFVSNSIALKDRTNTFPNTCKRASCCTPQMLSGPIAEKHRDSSRGFWNMVCLDCGAPIPSWWSAPGFYDVKEKKYTHNKSGRGGFRYSMDGERVANESIEYRCPECDHAHHEPDRFDMNTPDLGAKYIHEHPELVDIRPGFQWSKLAAPFTPWAELCSQLDNATTKNSLRIKMHYRNTVEGMPFEIKEIADELSDNLRKHCRAIPEDVELEEIYFSADTQDKGWYWAAGGFDADENLYILDVGYERDEDGVDEAWEQDFDGVFFTLGCMDEGGHGDRPKTVKRFCTSRKGMMTYKGDGRVSKTVDRFWKTSTVSIDGKKFKNKRILAVAKHYQAELLYRMHVNDDPANHYVWFPEKVSDRFLDHMTGLRPDKKKKNGEELENWVNAGRADHWFDCVKQLLVLRDARLHQQNKKKKGSQVKAKN